MRDVTKPWNYTTQQISKSNEYQNRTFTYKYLFIIAHNNQNIKQCEESDDEYKNIGGRNNIIPESSRTNK